MKIRVYSDFEKIKCEKMQQKIDFLKALTIEYGNCLERIENTDYWWGKNWAELNRLGIQIRKNTLDIKKIQSAWSLEEIENI